MAKKQPTQDLSIYLLKGNDRETVIDTDGLSEFEIDCGSDKLCYLYVKKPQARPPKWARFFEGYVDLGEFGKGASPAAVLFMSVEDRLFALPFGAGGRHLLDSDSIEEGFGLLTVLNSIPGDRVRSIDKTSLDARGTQTHVQASREASPQEFGLDVERDLVRAVMGTPTDEALGLRLHGMDQLRATLRVTLQQLPDKLKDYLKRSQYLQEAIPLDRPYSTRQR